MVEIVRYLNITIDLNINLELEIDDLFPAQQNSVRIVNPGLYVGS